MRHGAIAVGTCMTTDCSRFSAFCPMAWRRGGTATRISGAGAAADLRDIGTRVPAHRLLRPHDQAQAAHHASDGGECRTKHQRDRGSFTAGYSKAERRERRSGGLPG